MRRAASRGPRGLTLLFAFAAVSALVTGCSSDSLSSAELGISPDAFTKIVEGDTDFLTAGSERTAQAWIGYVDGDRVVRMGNGGSFDYEGLTLTLAVDPFPPTKFDVDLDLAITGSDGQPADVQVSAWYDMVFMTHGQPIAEVEQTGPGAFRMPLDLFMFGPWVVKTTISSGGLANDIPLVIYVWPST